MYESGLGHLHTPEENRDIFLSWNRSDKTFFAAGGCHILAHMFIQLHRGEDYRLIYLKPKDDMPGSHLYASDGTWAFDFNGWTLEYELLNETKHAFAETYPGWDCERIVIDEGLIEYLKHSNHLRPPEYFPELPWNRAYNYVRQFPAAPPDHGDLNIDHAR